MIRCRLTSSSSVSTPMTTCTTFWRICRRFARSVSGKCEHAPSNEDLLAHGALLGGLRRSFVTVASSRSPYTSLVVSVAVALALALVVVVTAQDSWSTYHGDFSGRRHSGLTQITPANVHQ